MIISLHSKVEKPTYQYISPVKFKDGVYSNSRSLVEAFLNHWDDALITFKCGDWKDFWNAYVDTEESTKDENRKRFEEIYNAMWSLKNHVNEDVLFTKAIHFFEPALKEIPCFIDSNVLSIWEGARFRYFFKRELKDEEQTYLMGLMRSNLTSNWEHKYNKSQEDILYACHLIREKIFSLYGYDGKEEAFLELLLDKSEEERTLENCIKAYQSVADRMYRENEFFYKCYRCTSLEEFAGHWSNICDKWSQKEWDAFIELLYEEKEDALSFRQWLLNRKEHILYNCLENWKNEVQKWEDKAKTRESLIPVKERREIPDASFAKEWSPSLRLIWVYGKYGEICSKEMYLEKISLFEKAVENFPERVKQMSKRRQLEEQKMLYVHIYQHLKDAFGHMSQFEAGALNAEFESLIKMWKEWEDENLRYYEDKKMLAKALRNHDLLSCWNHNFTYNPKKDHGYFDIRQEIALVTCAPVEGSYQKDCEAFLQLLEAGGEGCTPKEISGYRNTIWEYIYVPLAQKSEKPDAAAKEIIGEMLEYYFRFLEKLSEKISHTLSQMLSDMMYNKQEVYKKAIFKNYQIREIMSSIENCNRFDVDTWKRNLGKSRELPSGKGDVDYIPFYNNNEAYKKWIEKKEQIARIERICEAVPRGFEQLKVEWIDYVHKNYNKKSIAELYKAGKDKVREALEYQEMLVRYEKAGEQAVADANELCDSIVNERKQYELDGNKKRQKNLFTFLKLIVGKNSTIC